MLTMTAAAADPAPTKMTARARATTTAAAVRTAACARAKAALAEERRHEIVSRFLKVAESNSMNSATNGGARGAAEPGRPGGGTTGTVTKSDQQFKGLNTLSSASIAADRGGNERRVNVSKRCDYIKRGFLPEMDACTFNDVWRAGLFRQTSIYSPVL